MNVVYKYFLIRYIRPRWMKVLEACIVATVTATVGFLMMFSINDCKPIGAIPANYPTQVQNLRQ